MLNYVTIYKQPNIVTIFGGSMYLKFYLTIKEVKIILEALDCLSNEHGDNHNDQSIIERVKVILKTKKEAEK